jgi:hypothetical protein
LSSILIVTVIALQIFLCPITCRLNFPTGKKKKKKVKHVRSVSVPASFPTITEVTVVEDEEEKELEDIAPSPLSRRLRSTRGSLRKEHTWPRVLKALPSECVAYVGKDIMMLLLVM